MLGTVAPQVSGLTFVPETVNVSELPVGLDSVMFNDVGWPTVTFPKLAETGSSHVVPSAATERFSRPAPWAVGPMSCKPVNESLITKSARLTRADLICGGDQVEWRSRSTAAEPAMCGVDIDVPLKKAHPVPSPGQVSGLPTHVIELRTLTPTEVRSGLTAKSTAVGPWLLKPARMSLLAGVINSLNVSTAEAVVAPDARSAAPSFRPIITAGRSSPPSPSLAIAVGSPATWLITSTPPAPAAFALVTFVLKWHVPRFTIASFPEAPGSTLVQLVLFVSKRLYEAVGRAGNSPTAAPIVVPTPAGYVNGWPTKCWFVLAPTVMTLRARPGDSTVPAPGPLLPAATATTRPASTALSRPVAKRSLLPWKLPPSDRLRTSMPSAIAASTALRMSSLRALRTSPGKTL